MRGTTIAMTVAFVWVATAGFAQTSGGQDPPPDRAASIWGLSGVVGTAKRVINTAKRPARAAWTGLRRHVQEADLSFEVTALSSRRLAISGDRLAEPGLLENGTAVPGWASSVAFSTTRVVAVHQRSRNGIVLFEGGQLRSSRTARDERFARLIVQAAHGRFFGAFDGYYETNSALGSVPGVINADVLRHSYELTNEIGLRTGRFDRQYASLRGGLSFAHAVAEERYQALSGLVPPFELYRHIYAGATFTAEARMPLTWRRLNRETLWHVVARHSRYRHSNAIAASGGPAPSPSGTFLSLSVEALPLLRFPRLSLLLAGHATLGSQNHLAVATAPPAVELRVRYALKHRR